MSVPELKPPLLCRGLSTKEQDSSTLDIRHSLTENCTTKATAFNSTNTPDNDGGTTGERYERSSSKSRSFYKRGQNFLREINDARDKNVSLYSNSKIFKSFDIKEQRLCPPSKSESRYEEDLPSTPNVYVTQPLVPSSNGIHPCIPSSNETQSWRNDHKLQRNKTQGHAHTTPDSSKHKDLQRREIVLKPTAGKMDLVTHQESKYIVANQSSTSDVMLNGSLNIQGVENSNRQCLTVTATASLDTNVRAQTVNEINADNNLFIKTSSYRSAFDIVMEYHVVFIIGTRGTGKTMIGRHLLKAVCNSDPDIWQPMILKAPYEWRQLVDPDKCEVILMDNLFGDISFDTEAFKMLKEMLNNTSILKTKIIIFTISTNVYKEGRSHFNQNKFALFNPLSCININDELKDEQLSMKEKEAILSIHLNVFKLNNKINEEVKKAIISCKSQPCFPVCCKLFCKNPQLHNIENAVKFFEKPVLHLTNEIREFVEGNKREKTKYGALLLTMVKNGKLQIHLLDDFDKKTHHDELHSYLRTVGISDNVSLAKIKDAAKSLLGSYLRKKDGNFIFMNDSIHDAVCFCYGESCPDHLVDVCTLPFVHEYVISSDNTACNLKLSLNIKILIERFIREIQNGQADQLCTHQAFSGESFVKQFKSICEDTNRLDILTSVHPDSQLPLLYWAVWSKDGYFFEYILQQHMEQKKKLDQNVVFKIVTACCMTGNIYALSCIDTGLNIDLLEMASTNVPVPYMSTNTEAHNGLGIHVGQLIHVACFYGYIEIVEYLLNKCPGKHYINAQDSFGRTPCCITAKRGHVEIFRLLLHHRCDLTPKTRSGNLAIHEACKAGQTEIVKVIANNCPNFVFLENSDSRTPLQLAVLRDDGQLVQLLLGQAEVLSHERKNSMLLHLACKLPSKSTIPKMLCEKMKNVGELNHFIAKYDSELNTPLHLACKTLSDPSRAKMLIEFGANTNSLNKTGQTPLHLACANITSSSCWTDLVKTLVSHGAVSLYDNSHRMPIDYVSNNKDVRKFVQQSIDDARASITVP